SARRTSARPATTARAIAIPVTSASYGSREPEHQQRCCERGDRGRQRAQRELRRAYERRPCDPFARAVGKLELAFDSRHAATSPAHLRRQRSLRRAEPGGEGGREQ